MGSKEQKRAAIYEELHRLRLRSVADYKALLNETSIIVDASKYIEELKEKEVEGLDQDPIPVEVRVETVTRGFLINVFSGKDCPGLLVSILEAFEELGLDVVDATVSCSDGFRLNAIEGENHGRLESIDAQMVKQAVLQAIKNWEETNGQDDLQLERKAELSEQSKAITSLDKKQKSDRSEMQLFPILDRQLFMEELVLTELSPDSEEWDKAEHIHWMDKGLSNLPKEPKCPKLTLFFLQRNYKLRKISTSFFINMPLLEVLDLSDTGIMSLPKSLFELSCLKELYVKDCEFLMMLPPEIGKLKCLEVLDMEGTEIVNIPEEIKELAVLRCLRVSLYGSVDQDWKSRQADELIPFGVISALSKLEDIYIYVNPDDERWAACVEGILNEVCALTRLRILGFYFPRVKLLSCLNWTGTSMIYQSLTVFKFIVGDHSKRIISSLPSSVELELERMGRHDRCLKYINGEGVPENIKKVLQYAAMFHLDRHITAKNLTEFGIENMKELQYCVLGECNEIQVIIDGNDVHEEDDNGKIVCESSGDRRIGGLESLQFMYIYNMKSLKSIWEGPVHKRCFSRLKSLTMSTCPRLTTIFTLGLLENLHKLEEITVRDCPAIKSLVSCEEGVEHSANYLPQLRTISLHYVPELVSILSEVCICPKLEELSLYNCPKLKSLSIKEVSSEHLREITGEKDWWEALEWTQVKPNQFDDIFVPINEDTCL